MNLGIDIDNVISNFDDELFRHYVIHDKELRNNGIIYEDKYIRHMFDWSFEEEKEYYDNNIEEIVKHLKPIKDCKKYIKLLRKKGHVINIITGRDNGEYSDPHKITEEWLNKSGIEYDNIIYTNAYKHHEKADFCRDNNIDIMIDDSTIVCEKCVENNVDCILFDTKFNKNETRFKRTKSWKELFNIILNKRINVILDTDTYNECDDQFALSYMIRSQDTFNIEAITVAPFSHETKNVTVKEGQELSYNEILKICDMLNFDTKNMVFKGSMNYISNGYFDENPAVNKIIDTALKNNKTYILAIGAITNVALAIKKEPKIIDKIEVIWLGGNELDYNNNLEFNFRQDVSAVTIVFESKVKLTILPCLEVVSKLKIDINTLRKNIGNKSKLCDYLIARFFNDGYHGVQEERVIWDISVIAYMINKIWFKSMIISCPNIKENTSYETTCDKHKITMINDIDRNKVFEDLFRKLGV